MVLRSSNVIGGSNDETNFLHKLLLTDIQDSGLHRVFANISSGNIKLSKTQLSKIVQLGGFLLPEILPCQLVNSVNNSLANLFGEELRYKVIFKKMNILINVELNINL